jgi:hypothetical protein
LSYRIELLGRPSARLLVAGLVATVGILVSGCDDSESGNGGSASSQDAIPSATTVDFSAEEVPQGPGFWESLDESSKKALADKYQAERGPIGGSGPAGSFQKERVPSAKLVRLVDAYYESGKDGDLIEAFRVADERYVISIVAPPVIPAPE